MVTLYTIGIVPESIPRTFASLASFVIQTVSTTGYTSESCRIEICVIWARYTLGSV